MAQSAMKTIRKSDRLETTKNRVLDETTRRRRLRKQLEALEQDNFHEDPHANLQWHKKIPKFEDKAGKRKKNTENDGISAPGNLKKKRKIRDEHFKQRFRKTFMMLLEEESMQSFGREKYAKTNYFSARAPSSSAYPMRHFCAVCGFFSKYTCTKCGIRYCSIKCREIHTDTR